MIGGFRIRFRRRDGSEDAKLGYGGVADADSDAATIRAGGGVVLAVSYFAQCPECQGRGYQQIKRALGRRPQFLDRPCPSCNGSGLVDEA